MNQHQLEYLDRMEEGFKTKADEAREKLRTLRFVGEFAKMDTYADNMEICAQLVKQIRSDLNRLEKGGINTDEQETS